MLEDGKWEVGGGMKLDENFEYCLAYIRHIHGFKKCKSTRRGSHPSTLGGWRRPHSHLLYHDQNGKCNMCHGER